MQPGWIQAIISGIAIVASGSIAVFVPWWTRQIDARREARRRLSVITRFNSPSGLTIRLNYLPEFFHIGVKAHITLVNAPNVVLWSGRFEHSTATLTDGTHALAQFNGACLGGEDTFSLVDIYGDGSLSGVAFLMPSADVHHEVRQVKQAKLRIEVLTEDNESLLKVEMVVSAISPPEAPSFVGNAPA